MDKRTRRRKQKNTIKETFGMVNTILLVVIAIAIVAFVVVFLKGQLNGGEKKENSFLSGLFGGGTEETSETEELAVAVETETAAPEKPGFNVSADGKIYYLEDGAAIKDRWFFEGGKLFCAGADGYVKTGSFAEGAFRYETEETGAVKSITFNSYYNGDGNSAPDYPYSVKDNALLVYLNTGKTSGRMYQIQYKKAAETMSHALGGAENAQYTVPYSMKIAGGYVYWLPYLSDPDALEKFTAGNLYRMKPGAEKRQKIAENVDGYQVVATTSGETVICYYAEGSMHLVGEEACVDDDTITAFTEDMDYVFDATEEGKLYLAVPGGYRVAMASEAFKAGDYTYSLSEQGEILSVVPQTEVTIDGYTYAVASDSAFGVSRSVVTRKKAEEDAGPALTEAISGEFFGTTGNLHLSKAGDVMYAEYRDAMENSRIIRITPDGDVDIVNGFDPGGKEILLCGDEGDTLVVKVSGGETERDTYEKVVLGHFTPLAIGIVPVELGEGVVNIDDPASQSEEQPGVQAGVGPASAGAGNPDASSTAKTGPGAHTGEKAPGSSEISSKPQAPGIPDAPVLVNNGVGKAP